MIGKLKAFAAGFVLGVFVAPRSGRASREMLLERISEFFDAGGERLDRLEAELAARRAEWGEEWPEEEFPEPEPGEGA